MEENELKIDEIRKIDLYAPTALGKNFSYYPPGTSVDTASSVKYLTAMYLLTEDPGPDWYLEFERYLETEAYRNIAEKIEVHLDNKLQRLLEEDNRLYSRAVVWVGDTRYEKRVSFVKGSPENPFAMSDIEAKFLNLAAPVVGNKKAEGFLETIETYDRTRSMRQIVADLQVD